ncbi:MAG: GIY-YIG nuclease family protein [Patescibacteria group bacterium]
MVFLYIIKNNFNKLYIGISKDPNQRLNFHNSKSGASFTKSGNYKVVLKENYPNLKEARQREIQIKKWSRKKKDFIIERYKNNLTTKI